MNPGEYIASLFNKAMAGLGTNENKLIRLTARYFHHVYPPNQDLRVQIKQAYQQAHGRALLQAVESETSGDFKKLLSAIISRQ